MVRQGVAPQVVFGMKTSGSAARIEWRKHVLADGFDQARCGGRRSDGDGLLDVAATGWASRVVSRGCGTRVPRAATGISIFWKSPWPNAVQVITADLDGDKRARTSSRRQRTEARAPLVAQSGRPRTAQVALASTGNNFRFCVAPLTKFAKAPFKIIFTWRSDATARVLSVRHRGSGRSPWLTARKRDQPAALVLRCRHDCRAPEVALVPPPLENSA